MSGDVVRAGGAERSGPGPGLKDQASAMYVNVPCKSRMVLTTNS